VVLLDRSPDPDSGAGWVTWRIIDERVLVVETSFMGYPGARFLIDTGDVGSVAVSPELWDRFSGTVLGRRSAKLQIFPGYFWHHAAPVLWCRYLYIGEQCVQGMPITRGDPVIVSSHGRHGRIGLFALSRFDVIVDGPRMKMHVRPRRRFAWAYSYNRLGAAFRLRQTRGGIRAFATLVARGSPAEKAGIRVGDRLVAMNGRRLGSCGGVLDWSAFADFALLYGAAGTRVHFRWRRGRRDMDAVVELEEIFPEARKYAPSSNEVMVPLAREPAVVK